MLYLNINTHELHTIKTASYTCNMYTDPHCSPSAHTMLHTTGTSQTLDAPSLFSATELTTHLSDSLDLNVI